MRIRYQSRHGVKSARIPQIVGDHELASWTDGQERDIPDDLELSVRVVRPRPGTGEMRPVTLTAKAVDAVLMGGPDFVDAATGVHPDFTCAVCGRETLDEHYPVQQPSGAIARVPYADENGARLCGRDYLLAQPAGSIAWTWHGAVEQSLAFDEAMTELHARKTAAAAPPVAPKYERPAPVIVPPTVPAQEA